jgi:hypothetical protein
MSVRALIVLIVLAASVSAVPATAAARDLLPVHGDPAGPFVRDAAARRTGQRALSRPAVASVSPTGCAVELRRDDTANATAVGPQIKLVYAHTSDTRDSYATRKDQLAAAAARISEILADASGGTADLRWDTGTACGPDTVDITSVALPRPRTYYDGGGYDQLFTRVGDDTRAALGWPRSPASPLEFGDAPMRNLAIFVDGVRVPAIAGLGAVGDDDRAEFRNVHNLGGLQAMVFPSALPEDTDVFTESLLHEISHTLGAVQASAPNGTGWGHCTDEQDVMCYADGGPRNTLSTRCGASAVFFSRWDCNQDDYYNPSPAPGSYLATHWNVANSLFLCRPERCRGDHAAPSVTLARSGGPPEVGDPVTLTATAAMSGSPVVGYLWDLDGSGEPAGVTAPTVTTSWAAAGPQTVRVRAFNADGLYADRTLIVPVNEPPRLRIDVPVAVRAGQPAPLTASSNATHGGVTQWVWTFGDGTPPVTTTVSEMQHAFAAEGTFTVSVSARYADGKRATTARALTVGPAAAPPPDQAPSGPQPTPAPPAESGAGSVGVSTPGPAPTATPGVALSPAGEGALEVARVKLDRRRGRATLRLAVPAAGRLVVVATTARRVGAKRLLVVRRVLERSKAGEVSVVLRATGRARRELLRTGLLALRVTLSFAPRAQPAQRTTATVTLRRVRS